MDAPYNLDSYVEVHVQQCLHALKGATIVAESVGWGTLGLGGGTGFATSLGERVSHPDFSAEAWEFVSAHAPSKLLVDIHTPLNVRGLLNTSSTYAPANPVEFWVDQNLVGRLIGPGQTTGLVHLEPGRHLFEAVHLGNEKTGRHSVWCIQPASVLEAVAAPSSRVSPDRLAVVTVACYAPSKVKEVLRFLASSALHNGIRLNVFGVGEVYQHFQHAKVSRLLEWLDRLDANYTHILYVDARDVVFQGDLDEICDVFNTLNFSVVIGTEADPWPVRHSMFAKLFPPLTSGRNFPSAGVFMGERVEIVRALNTLNEIRMALESRASHTSLPDLNDVVRAYKTTHDRRRTVDDDQFLWQVAYLKGLCPIYPDADGALVLNMSFAGRTLDPWSNPLYRISRRRLVLRDTGCSPPILHFPGAPAHTFAHQWAGYLGLI